MMLIMVAERTLLWRINMTTQTTNIRGQEAGLSPSDGSLWYSCTVTRRWHDPSHRKEPGLVYVWWLSTITEA